MPLLLRVHLEKWIVKRAWSHGKWRTISSLGGIEARPRESKEAGWNENKE